jgi:hypothetical protein
VSDVGKRPAAALPPLSRDALAQLRRGELPPAEVTALVERMAGLAAPPAPPEGDLVPNGSGWVIAVGGRDRQLYPAFNQKMWRWRMSALWFIWLATVPIGSTYLRISIWSALVAFSTVSFTLSGVKLRRHLRAAKPVDRLSDVPDGTVVRVTGVIGPQAAVPTLFRGVPAVLFRNRMAAANETRGIDFTLDVADGDQAKVAVRRAFLLDPPRRIWAPAACGPVVTQYEGGSYVLRSEMFRPLSFLSRFIGRYESSVGPGDRVEVCGIVRHDLAPDVVPRSSRQVPTRVVLTGDEDTPLLVRRRPGG